ncbi:MAG: lipoate--protein ligase family protein [Euryarchaeota archaeon]|nr:lipoate--protein ligase family protein [Euryarchaeota archaeon]
MRYIDLGPIELHATEEAIAKSGIPTLMLWTARDPTVSLGYFSCAEEEMDMDAADRLGLEVTRRPSGGGTVLFDDRQLCYSIVVPQDSGILPRAPRPCFRKAAQGLINALEDTWGIEAEFAGKNDVVARGKKVSGNAQTNKHRAKIQHGSFLVDFSYWTAAKVLRIPAEKVEDKGIPRGPVVDMIMARVTTLKELLEREVPLEEAKEALKKGFEKALGVSLAEGSLTAEEEAMAEELAAKYRDPGWVYRR